VARAAAVAVAVARGAQGVRGVREEETVGRGGMTAYSARRREGQVGRGGAARPAQVQRRFRV